MRGPSLDPRIAELTGETLVELLDRAVARTPERVAIVLRHGLAEERWTYRQLGERSLGAAAVLAARGVTPGARVVTWGPNDPWLVAAFFAAWRLGAVVVPLDLRMMEDVAVRIARRTKPTLVLASDEHAAGPARALKVPILRLAPDELEPGVGVTAPPLPGVVGVTAPPLPGVTPDMAAEIVFTSGTTADPKGVVLTHGQVIHNARVIAQTGMAAHPDRALGIIPLSHMYGQIVPLFLGLISGSTLVFLHALSPSAIGATLRRERITAITAVPQLARLMLDGIESEASRQGGLERLQRARRLAQRLPMRLRRVMFRRVHAALGGSLEVITSGGAYLPPELQQAWEAMGVLVVQGYGGTECAAITGHTRSSRRPGTAGMPLAGLEVRIAADGELLVRGPSVMSGYWQAPEATAEVLTADGWLHTGDAARFDEHGEVVILGRTRDRIALPNGLKVYPDDVELALRDTDAVRGAVVFESAPGRLAAVLVPVDADATDAMLAAAVKRANATLGVHQRVAQWQRWPEADFPRTHTLKVRREPVKAWYREATGREAAGQESAAPGVSESGSSSKGHGRLRGGRRQTPSPTLAPGTVLDPDDIVGALCLLVSEIAAAPGEAPQVVTPATSLESLGFDSLRRVTLALRIEEAFDAPLPDEEVTAASDIADLARRVTAYRGRPQPPPRARWAFSRPVRLVRRVLDATLTRWLVDLIAQPTAEGLEHLAGLTEPALLCPNHCSHLDVPSVRRVLPATLRGRSAVAAASDYFFDRPVLGPIVALGMGAFPFGRATDIRASMERVADFVADGWSVMLFPEGTRSPDGRLGPMRDGIGLLATSIGAPVVPIHIAGTHALLPKGRALPRRRRGARVVVRFGEPLRFAPDTSVQEATRAVGAAIAALAAQVETGGS